MPVESITELLERGGIEQALVVRSSTNCGALPQPEQTKMLKFNFECKFALWRRQEIKTVRVEKDSYHF